MSLVSEVEEEEELIASVIKYSIMSVQWPLSEANNKVDKVDQKVKICFLNITPEGIEVRNISREVISQLITINSFNYEEVLKESTVSNLLEYQQILKAECKTHQTRGQFHYIMGLHNHNVQSVGEIKKNVFLVCRFETEKAMQECADEINLAIKQEKDYIKKSTINYLGIEENVRKIIDKILLTTQKGEVLQRLKSKISEKVINLDDHFYKMLLYALMGNHPQFQAVIRKEKIQAYDIEKKKYDESIRNENRMADIIDPDVPQIKEHYSEKRKMDGVVLKRQAQVQKEQKQNQNNKNIEELYIEKIPDRKQNEIDSLIGISMQDQEPRVFDTVPEKIYFSYRAQKVKVPVKQYSLITKDVQWVKRENAIGIESLDDLSKVTIEAIKLMYQLMKKKSEYRSIYGENADAIDKILDCLKDVLTQLQTSIEEKRANLRQAENKSLSQFIKSANRNYMEYRRHPNKLY